MYVWCGSDLAEGLLVLFLGNTKDNQKMKQAIQGNIAIKNKDAEPTESPVSSIRFLC